MIPLASIPSKAAQTYSPRQTVFQYSIILLVPEGYQALRAVGRVVHCRFIPRHPVASCEIRLYLFFLWQIFLLRCTLRGLE